MDTTLPIQGAYCPTPLPHHHTIVMGHGSGGKMSHDLIKRLFLTAFSNPILERGDDSSVVFIKEPGKLAFTTDAHVVAPIFFPGGDIGKLAVCGTVNDLAMMGAAPLYLCVSFILEEGLAIETLERICASMQAAAQEAGVQIVAGDTKVVQRGNADGLYITTSGIGILPPMIEIGGAQARPGDKVILSGSVGDHGIAVLSARGELGLENQIQSDVAPLNGLVECMLKASSQIHVLRDPTRGGVATTLNEIALQSNVNILIEEDKIPVQPAVMAACEMLGFDPLYVANEGKLLAITAAEDVAAILSAMQSHPYGRQACVIGEVATSPAGKVLMKTTLGSKRMVDMLAGEMLPRIC